jgi:hypothetical protein
MKDMHLLLDEDDYRSIQQAIARRQSWRHADGGCILPAGESNTPGAIIAEICRGWLEMLDATPR